MEGRKTRFTQGGILRGGHDGGALSKGGGGLKPARITACDQADSTICSTSPSGTGGSHFARFSASKAARIASRLTPLAFIERPVL